MLKLWHTIKRELAELLPPTLFFFAALSLLTLTKRIVLQQYGIAFTDFAGVVVGALVIGKVVLIADNFHFIDRYLHKPLIYNTVWKTVVYFIAGSVVHIGEEAIPKLIDGSATITQLFNGILWPHFWIIHLWLAVLLFVYCALRELIRAVGKHEVRQMFFGQRHG